MDDQTVRLNGVDIHYPTIGDGPVLFLVSPGWGVASADLQRAFSSVALEEPNAFFAELERFLIS